MLEFTDINEQKPVYPRYNMCGSSYIKVVVRLGKSEATEECHFKNGRFYDIRFDRDITDCVTHWAYTEGDDVV